MEVVFFSPRVHKDIYSLGELVTAKATTMISLLQLYGYELGMPYSKPLSRNLFELRMKGREEFRILYCFYRDRIVILHSFKKKTQRTPRREINLALKRMAILT